MRIVFVLKRAMKIVGMAALALATIIAWMPLQAGAATGSIRITITRAQFVIGGGDGTLRLLGERYPLRMGGVSTGPFGAPRVDLVGRAYNVRTAANIHGDLFDNPRDGTTGNISTSQLAGSCFGIARTSGCQAVH